MSRRPSRLGAVQRHRCTGFGRVLVSRLSEPNGFRPAISGADVRDGAVRDRIRESMCVAPLQFCLALRFLGRVNSQPLLPCPASCLSSSYIVLSSLQTWPRKRCYRPGLPRACNSRSSPLRSAARSRLAAVGLSSAVGLHLGWQSQQLLPIIALPRLKREE